MKRSFFILLAIALLSGCGKNKDESLAKKTGNKVGEVLTDFTTGVGRGVDNQMQIAIELSPEVTEKGFTNSISKINGLDVDKSISVYLISSEPFSGEMLVKAMNKQNLEIGRAVAEVEFEKDDAQYITFIFQKETDMQLIHKFSLNIK